MHSLPAFVDETRLRHDDPLPDVGSEQVPHPFPLHRPVQLLLDSADTVFAVISGPVVITRRIVLVDPCPAPVVEGLVGRQNVLQISLCSIGFSRKSFDVLQKESR